MATDKLFELVYCSKAAPGLKNADIDSILKVSKSFNTEKNITGCLLYYAGEFAQILEGEQDVVMDLYEHIKRDDRHTFVLLLGTAEISTRRFKGWGMAYQSLDSDESTKDELGKITSNLQRFSATSSTPSRMSELFQDVSKLIMTGGLIKR